MLEAPLERYANSINKLQLNLKVEANDVLEILTARDALEALLKVEPTLSKSSLSQMIELDGKLREKARQINWSVQDFQLAEWRESRNPSVEAWWWKLETIALHTWDHLDWLWKVLSIIGWAANISLLANIATRFLGGGGIGVFSAAAVALPSILALLQASSEVTKAGGEGFEKLLDRKIPIWGKKIPKHYHQEVKLGLTLAMSGLLTGFWFLLPAISDIYSQNGLKNYRQRNFGAAEQDYQRAISLNADNTDAQYNLGSLYEEWQEIEKAKKAYQAAITGDLPDAYNNLGRLYILDKKYPQAAVLLTKGLGLTQDKEIDPEVKYSLFKNLGWVRLEQKRYKEAQAHLEAAIGLLGKTDAAKYTITPGAAHCLMAQVSAKLKAPNELEQWRKCVQFGSRTNADEDAWLHLANEKLSKEKEQ